jgi:hypothetical protein
MSFSTATAAAPICVLNFVRSSLFRICKRYGFMSGPGCVIDLVGRRVEYSNAAFFRSGVL